MQHGSEFTKIFTWLLLGGALLAGPLQAQVGGDEFLRIGAGGRALAMGGAYVALADDESSALWNPAGIANAVGLQGYLSYVSMYQNLAAHNFAAISLEMTPGMVMGASWVRLSIDDIPRYGPLTGTRFDRFLNPKLRSTGEPEGYFASRDDALFFTLGKALDLEFLIGNGLSPYVIPARLAFGVNMKFIHRELDHAVATAQGIDAGAIFELQGLDAEGGIQRSLAVGISLFDLATSKLSWQTGNNYADPLPLRILFGVAVKQQLPGVNSQVSFSLDRGIAAGEPFRVGGEYLIGAALALRGGYRPEGWSVGAGLYFGSFLLDYSFAGHDLGASHRVGGGIRF